MQIHIAVEVTFTVENNTVHSSQSILLNHVITLGQFINKCFMLSVSGRKLTCAVSSSVYMKDIRWLVTKNTCLFTVWGHFVYRRCCRWQCQSGKDVGCWFRSKEKQGFNEKDKLKLEREAEWLTGQDASGDAKGEFYVYVCLKENLTVLQQSQL